MWNAPERARSESYSSLMQPELTEIDATIDVTVEDEDTSTVEGALHLQLSPSYYSQLENLDMEFTGHTDDTNTNLTALIDYPGYLGLDGSIGMVIVEPPYSFVLDLLFDAQLYYSSFPREQLQMMVGMLPLFESQLASEVRLHLMGISCLSSLSYMITQRNSTTHQSPYR